MIKVCLMKLGFKWIFRHKLRYVLSWMSFALVSVVLITVYSISAGISTGIVSHISGNPLSFQTHIRNQRIKDGAIVNDITSQIAEKMKKELGASEMRILYDTFLVLKSVGGSSASEYSGRIVAFNAVYPLILSNESTDKLIYNGSIDRENCSNEAVVTTEFLAMYGYDTKSVLGKELVFSDESGSQYSFVIAAALSNINSESVLSDASIYLTYYQNSLMETPFSSVVPATITFDFPLGTDMEEVNENVAKYEYPFSSSAVNTEKLHALVTAYLKIGSVLGLVMISISAMSLINSTIITINENAAFMNLFRLMGLTKANSQFLFSFITTVQGVIGGLLGLAFSLVAQNQIVSLVESFNITLYNTSDGFKTDPVSCVIVMGICIAVSILTGVISLFISSKSTSVISADCELV